MSDRDQRLAAVDPARSVIVQAPAGSGKTTLLVERFLALLAVVEEPEEILAITFTRKAAAEMRARVLRFLAPGFTTDAPHEQAAAERAAALRDKVRRWQLAANPERLMIRTIDSFSHFLARTMPVASRLGPVPEPADNTQALYRRAARRVLDATDNDPLAGDLEILLLWRDHRTQDIEDLLVGLLGKREQWLRALGVTGTPERRRFEGVLDEVVRQRLEQTRSALEQALDTIFSSELELIDLLRYAQENLAAEGKPADPDLFGGDKSILAPVAGHLPQWRALGAALLTKEGEFRRKVDKRDGFPPKTPQKERFVELLASLADQAELANLLNRARALPDPRYADPEWNVLASLIRILERAAAELELVFAETGQTDFTGLSRASLRGLGDDESGYTDLALYLDRRIQHILVDEYQDTNWAQVHLLEKLTHGWQPDDGRSLFLVGDPMQSIYRFREAEVGLFIRTREQGLGGLRLDAPRLTRNFRARSELVDWVNRALGPGFPEREDVAAGAIAFAPSEPGRSEGGRITTLSRTDEAAEARAVVDLLQARIAGHAEDPGWKAAVIVRARGHLAELLPELTRRGIAFRAVKLDPLLARPVARDLLAIARALVFPADRAALLAILRGPLCGLRLSDLHALAGDGADSLNGDATDRLSDPDAQSRARRVFTSLKRGRESIGRRALRDRVEGVWRRLGGPGGLARPADHNDARMLLDALDIAEQQGLLDDWNDLMELLAGQYTEGDPPDPDVKVELLTMHGAKGLEWDLLVLPALHRRPRPAERELLYWLPFTSEHDQEQVLLGPLRAAWQTDNSPLVDLIRAEQGDRDAFEHQRLLYVAATRAREELVLSATLDPGDDNTPESVQPARGSLLERLWPHAGAAFREDLAQALAEGAEESPNKTGTLPDQRLRRVPSDWPPAPEPGLDWTPATPPREDQRDIDYNWAGAQARRTGTVLHALLEQVGILGIENLDDDTRVRLERSIPIQLRAQGTGAAALDQAVDIVREAFDHTLTTDTGRWILSGEHQDAACELAISGIVDGEFVNAFIDRTFIDEHGTRWIIDYKSGVHEGGDLDQFLKNEAERYREQLQRYRRLFEQMGETNIKTALYLPRHGVLQEVDSDE